MIINSLKIAWRGFLRNRMYSAFNLISLLIGLFVAYVAIGYIGFEYSYDKFHNNSDNLYRLVRTMRSQDYSIVGFEQWSESAAGTQLAQIEGLKNVSGVKDATQFLISSASEFVEWDSNISQEKEILTTNTPKSFVNLFTWKLKYGSLNDFSKDINKVLLTASSAERIFGKEMGNNPSIINRTLKVGDESYKISAVIEDVPLNSHFDFSLALNKPKIDYWGSRIYLSLNENTDYKKVESVLNASLSSINPSLINNATYKKHYLQPIKDIHLKSNVLYESKTPGNHQYIWLIGFFAIFIIIITLFNYANFTLAIKSKQGKSIGIKKAIGAKDASIAIQFFVEGILLALLAVPILAVVIPLVIPSFNTLMRVSLNSNMFSDPITLLVILILAILLGFLASLAPALVLSKRNVLSLFKENLKANRFQHFSVRKYLIISQFVVLITITSVSYFVMSQISYIENKNVGFQKEGILYAYTSEENQNAFQQRLRQIPEIEAVGNGSSFGIGTFNTVTYQIKGNEEIFDDANQLYLDYGALKAYKIKTTLGNVSEENLTRKTLINRTAAEKFAKVKNISVDEVIGTTIITEPEYVADNGQAGIPFEVAGIFEDINVFSLHEKLAPYFIVVSPNVRLSGRSIIAYNAANEPNVINKIKEVHQELNEPFPLEIEFLSQNMNNLYLQDKQTANLILGLNILAIILAILGIVGITIFLIVARTKEIGIRKVLGAGQFTIIKSTVKEYVWFIAIALLISWPTAFISSRQWLSNFAYRIEIQQIVFVLIGILTFVFTALIVGLVTLKTSNINPIKSLRTE